MSEKNTKRTQNSASAPRQMNGSQDAPSTNSPSITQSKGRSNHTSN